jgi:RNA polymerase sigma-70 factor (ECF subfamily)
MQEAEANVGSDHYLDALNGETAAQELQNTLSRRLPSFYRNAYRFLGNAADAEDAVQDALLAAYTHLDQFRGQAQMSSWLTAIVSNCARMQLRRRSRQIQVPLDEPIGQDQVSVSDRLADRKPSPEDECRHTELNRRLMHFTTRLSPTLRKTFQLRELDGLSIRETADILGVPAGTVKAQLARARAKLKQLMQLALRPPCRSAS